MTIWARFVDIVLGKKSSGESDEVDLREVRAELGKQLKYVGNLKRRALVFKRNYDAAEKQVIDLASRLIGLGINPLSDERHGRYAFIDRHGVIRGISGKAEKIFGYNPIGNNYRKFVSGGLHNLFDVADGRVPETRNFDVLTVKIGEGENVRQVRLKEVHAEPYMDKENKVCFGYVIDFRQIGRIEEARRKVQERTRSYIGKLAERTRGSEGLETS